MPKASQPRSDEVAIYTHSLFTRLFSLLFRDWLPLTTLFQNILWQVILFNTHMAASEVPAFWSTHSSSLLRHGARSRTEWKTGQVFCFFMILFTLLFILIFSLLWGAQCPWHFGEAVGLRWNPSSVTNCAFQANSVFSSVIMGLI